MNVDNRRIKRIRESNEDFLSRHRDNPVYAHETRLHNALDVEHLLLSLDRAREALEALRQPKSMNAIVIKYRLGAYLFPEDAVEIVIDFGLGKRQPDPSTLKEEK